MREFSFVKQNILYFIEKQLVIILISCFQISLQIHIDPFPIEVCHYAPFSRIYKEVSADWLLTGKGEMLKTSAQNITQNGNTNVNNGHNVSGQGNIIKQTNDELMEIIREKDKQIAEKDKQIAMLIEKISK